MCQNTGRSIKYKTILIAEMLMIRTYSEHLYAPVFFGFVYIVYEQTSSYMKCVILLRLNLKTKTGKIEQRTSTK